MECVYTQERLTFFPNVVSVLQTSVLHNQNETLLQLEDFLDTHILSLRPRNLCYLSMLFFAASFYTLFHNFVPPFHLYMSEFVVLSSSDSNRMLPEQPDHCRR